MNCSVNQAKGDTVHLAVRGELVEPPDARPEAIRQECPDKAEGFRTNGIFLKGTSKNYPIMLRQAQHERVTC